MTTVMQLMQDAVKYEEPLMAHALLLGIRHGKWKAADPETAVDWSLLDFDEVMQARDENILGMTTVKLYSSPLNNKQHAIIMAETLEEAASAFSRTFKTKPRVIHHLPHGMDVSAWWDDLNDTQTWRQVRDKTTKFPAVVGVYHKEEPK